MAAAEAAADQNRILAIAEPDQLGGALTCVEEDIESRIVGVTDPRREAAAGEKARGE